MVNRIILFLLLFGTWLVFSGFFSSFFVVAGLVSCFAAVILSAKMSNINKSEQLGSLGGFILKLPLYLLWLIKEIIVSGVSTSSKMWQIEPEISPQDAWIPTHIKDNLGLTVFGNSITITPGTVTLAVRDDGMVYVHALTEEGIDSLRGGIMSNKVHNLTKNTGAAA